MTYKFIFRKTGTDVIRTYDIIRKGALEDLSTTTITNELKEMGLSYRRIDMLHDIRRARAVVKAKTEIAKMRAEKWFDEVFEPMRAERKIPAKKMSELIDKWKEETLETEEEIELGRDYEERYKEI